MRQRFRLCRPELKLGPTRRSLKLGPTLCVLFALACSVPREQSILDRFFIASRLRDRTVLSRLSTVAFEPLKDGIIVDYTITHVTQLDDAHRDVAIVAPVRVPDGRTVVERLVFSLERGALKSDPVSADRWIVTAWSLKGIDEAGSDRRP